MCEESGELTWTRIACWCYLWSKLEIIGEAAGKVSSDIRSQYGAIPWQDISGMRNRLIHAYFDVDLDVVWTTVTKDLPVLKTELEKIL